MYKNEFLDKTLLIRKCYHKIQPYRSLNPLQDKIKKVIEKKIQDKHYIFEYIDCPICVESQFATISKCDRYGLQHHIVICAKCGLIMANPRMTQESYHSFYNFEYRPLHHGYENYIENFIQEQIHRGRRVFEYLKSKGVLSRIPKDALVVEIGCGAGGILKVFSDYGYDILGIDIGEQYLAYGRDKYGLNLQIGALDTVRFDRTPSLIIYSHVIEHILDIQTEVAALQQVISEQSFIYIETPGVRYLHRSNYDFMDLIQKAHVYYFTLSSLSNLLSLCGLDLVSGDEYIRSIFRKSSSTRDETPIENSFQSTINYLKRMEWQRSFIPLSPYALARRLKSRLVSIWRKST